MACTFSKAPHKALLHPLNWLRNSLGSIVLLSVFLGLGSCYEDTKTCRCARQPRFNLKDDCHPAEQFIDEWADIQLAAVFYHPGTERFMPEYNPKNPNEVAFILKIRTPNDSTDKAIKPMLVVANLLDGSHRFLHELPFKDHDTPIAWGRSNHIVINNSQRPIYFINASTGNITDSIEPFLGKTTWNYNGDLIIGWAKSTQSNKWGMTVLDWPELKVVSRKFEDLPAAATSTITWSQSNEIPFRITNEIGAVNFDTEVYQTIFQSDAEIEIGLKAPSGAIYPDFEWSPNNNDLYFVNSTGIFKVRKGDNKQYRIKKNCPNRQYQEITISPEGDKIIAQRRDIETERDGRYISENIKLVIMDMNGCNEEILFEDWDGLVSGKP